YRSERDLSPEKQGLGSSSSYHIIFPPSSHNILHTIAVQDSIMPDLKVPKRWVWAGVLCELREVRTALFLLDQISYNFQSRSGKQSFGLSTAPHFAKNCAAY